MIQGVSCRIACHRSYQGLRTNMLLFSSRGTTGDRWSSPPPTRREGHWEHLPEEGRPLGRRDSDLRLHTSVKHFRLWRAKRCARRGPSHRCPCRSQALLGRLQRGGSEAGSHRRARFGDPAWIVIDALRKLDPMQLLANCRRTSRPTRLGRDRRRLRLSSREPARVERLIGGHGPMASGDFGVRSGRSVCKANIDSM